MTKRDDSPESASIADLTARRRLQEQIAGLECALDAALTLHEVPIQLTQALRAPTGTLHTVPLHLPDGQGARIVVHPIGEPDPVREAAIWQHLTTVGPALSPGRQLQSMDPAIAVVEIGTATLVNTAQSRLAVRAALRMLRFPALALPAPLAWIWRQARRRPAQAGVAVVAAVAVGTAVAMTAHHPTGQAPVLTQARPSVPIALDAAAQPTSSPAPTMRDTRRPHAEPTVPPRLSPGPQPPAPGDRPSPTSAPKQASSPAPGRSSQHSRQSVKSSAAAPRPTAPSRSTTPPSTRPTPTANAPSPTRDVPASEPTPTSTATSSAPPPEPSSPPAPTASAPPPAGRDCRILNVDIKLPILGVDLCL